MLQLDILMVSSFFLLLCETCFSDLASGYDLVRTASAENICSIGNELFEAASEPDTVSSTSMSANHR